MREVRTSMRRHWPFAVAVLVLIPVVMGVYLLRRDVERPPARFTTSVDVLIPSRLAEDPNAPEVIIPPVLLQGQPELALAPETKEKALELADIAPKDEDDIALSASLEADATIMRLTASTPTPELTAAAIDGYIEAYEEGRRESVYDASIERAGVQAAVVRILLRRLDQIEPELEELEVPLLPMVPDGAVLETPAGTPPEGILLVYERNAILNEIQVRRVDYGFQATSSVAPGNFSDVVQRRSTARITPPPPSPLVPLLGILAAGLLLAALVPFVIDRLDSTITEPRSAPGAMRTGLLGTIPFMPRRLHAGLAPPGSTWELAFRSLAATSISTDRLPRAIMVTSPAGVTQDPVAANFAAALARLGVRVALVGTVPRQDWFIRDVDEATLNGERRPTEPMAVTAPALGAPAGTGPTAEVATFPELLQDAQAGRLADDLRPRLGRRDIDNLFIVPPGEDEVELSLDGLPPLLDALSRSEIDITVIAGPALLDDPNATIIAWSTRHVLWAIEMGDVNKSDAHLAADRLELAGVEPFGIALVNRRALRA